MPRGPKNAILAKIAKTIESGLHPALKEPVERIVLAGMKLLYDEKTHERIVKPIYRALQQNNFQPNLIANGMVNFLGTLFKASRGAMKIEAAYPAGIILLTYVLDDLEQSYGLTVTKEMVKAIGSEMVAPFIKAFGLKPEDATAPGLAGSTPSPTPAAPTAPQAGGLASQGA